ncbi:thioredoxin family protein [Flavihumibacter sp. CACIAM 22H1]|uniref:thioredoxin family protein n=1 Tax=Flavihumibacter sp. CACIAM 22H1 TaxID=1812911 RepID=UPI0007A8A7FF|nr:thioredoxin family protein [Flavihumibacter sp. CACIAM 22H1]KYP14479.1 MAG: thiol-disulfide isomerase [Flavihumibacter sp. CACIAM 22H1]
MKLIFTTLLAVLSIYSVKAQIKPLALGAPIPKTEIRMKDVSGKLVSLSDVRTPNGLLVMFSCNTCPYVEKNQSRTRAIGSLAAEKGIGFIVLNSNEGSRDSEDSFKDMQQYARAQQYAWPYAIDSKNELADAFGASRTPECFLFDANGKLVYHGAIDDNPADLTKIKRKHLEEALLEVAEGKEVSVKQSRSIGCSIKRKT